MQQRSMRVSPRVKGVQQLGELKRRAGATPSVEVAIDRQFLGSAAKAEPQLTQLAGGGPKKKVDSQHGRNPTDDTRP